MSYLEELLPEFRNGAKIRMKDWRKDTFIIHRDGSIVTNDNYEYALSIRQTLSDQWELYQEPVDWDYIIKNKCLCWFWDDNFNWATCGTMIKIEKSAEYKFVMSDDAGNRSTYKCCRPVRRDEVTFYEDKKDVL